MKVLGIDTSTILLSAAVLDDSRLVAERTRKLLQVKGRRSGRSDHAEAIIPLIEDVLGHVVVDFSGLSLLGVAVGPGSFTGLRIGISTAKGLVYGLDTPVVGVRTLEASAFRVPAGDGVNFICPLMDARKGEVYGALYRRTATTFECLIEDSVAAPETLVRQVSAMATGPCIFVGTGACAYAELIARCTGRRALVTDGTAFPTTAFAVARIAEERFRASPDKSTTPLTPYYIRPPDAVAGGGHNALR